MSRPVDPSDLYKDKIEVSLDGRQIFYLFFGGAVIVGLVFVLGVMVGRRVEARGHVERARVEAAVDPLAALDHLEGGLSFQGALRGGDTPTADVDKTIAAMQKGGKKAEDKKLEAKVEGKKDDKKAEDKKAEDKKVEAKAEAKGEDKKVEAKADDKKLDTKTDAKKVEVKADDKKLDTKTDAKKVEAKPEDKKVEAKPEDKKLEAKAEDKKTDDKKTDKAKFTLQLSSFQSKAEAQAYLDSIKSAGFQPYVTEGSVDGKQYFRVRLGSYKSIDAANDAKAEFEKAAKKTAIVTKL